MSDPIERRVTHLEFRADGHDKDIASIKEENEDMATSLRTIQDNLKQIKWIAVGAIGFFVVQQIGVLELLKKLVHL